MPAAERRVKLLEAAYRVMSEGGVAAGTTRAIVREAGMSLAAFHYCFDSREEMLRALIVDLSERERGSARLALAAAEAGTVTDLAGTVRMALLGYLDHLEQRSGEELLLLELNHHALRTPALRELATEQYRGYYDGIQQLLVGMAEQTGVRWRVGPEQVARLAVTLTDGLTTTWLADRDSAAARETIETIAEMVAGLAAPA
ncbi:hypothetical protein ASJ30_00705 [Janibacter indicus]|uniref:HTH tetR-type domain-containing protein n=1 Tax=Janibacter indicus TaxID=857417 RepID=A0A1L3MCW3_9MICO|nr:TetR/AcrR family transcriptional regulator [Janibacter indicus]APH00231.1 hypothetical protein ASJ30_00705 [Janibacter indicus]